MFCLDVIRNALTRGLFLRPLAIGVLLDRPSLIDGLLARLLGLAWLSCLCTVDS